MEPPSPLSPTCSFDYAAVSACTLAANLADRDQARLALERALHDAQNEHVSEAVLVSIRARLQSLGGPRQNAALQVISSDDEEAPQDQPPAVEDDVDRLHVLSAAPLAPLPRCHRGIQ